MSGDAELHRLLNDLQKDATAIHPMPSAEVAAHMVPARRQSVISRHGAVVTALIVVGTLGVGVTAAAASPDVRAAAQQVFQTVTGGHLPSSTIPDPLGSHGASSWTPLPSRSSSASPHPNRTNHPGPTDHPGNGATNAASPDPGDPHTTTPGNGHASSEPIPPGVGKGHTP
jgi:hypothetical protein